MPALLKLVLTTCTLADVGQGVREVISRHKQVDLPKASVKHAEAVITSIMNLSKVNLLFLPELDSSYQTDDASPLTCQEAFNSYVNSNSKVLYTCSDLKCACELLSPAVATLAQALQADQECAVEQPNFNREMMERLEASSNLHCGDESTWPSPLFEACVSPLRGLFDVRMQMIGVCRDSADIRACARDSSACSDAFIEKVKAFNKKAASEECSAILSPAEVVNDALCNVAVGA